MTVSSVKIFYCYAHEDAALRSELDAHLSPLRRKEQITTWYDRKIMPGSNWENEISARLDEAGIVLLLVSAAFINSDYCWGIEMEQALKRHETGGCKVIPIILRAVLWRETPLGKLQALPMDGKPIIQWPDRDAVWESVAQQLSRMITQGQGTAKEGDRVPVAKPKPGGLAGDLFNTATSSPVKAGLPKNVLDRLGAIGREDNEL